MVANRLWNRREGEAVSDKTYLCIDLKSFYASVECADRGLDPFTTNLVVADPERSANTICLAITPALKARGVRNRCRVRDIPPGIDYLTAVPRMRRYMEVSTEVVKIYLRFVSHDDMHVYSVDESFIDVTPYLSLYRCDARTLARRMIDAVRRDTGITATAGIGPNLFLAKVALDVCAKHAPDGIAELDEESFRREIWFHQPITDIWGIGRGIARRLERYGVRDLAGVCALRPATLRREFGKNGELLIDHAWGLEPATIAQIHAYRPKGSSVGNGQVLMRDYTAAEARTVLKEMVVDTVLRLASEGKACTGVSVGVGFSGSYAERYAGGAGGSARLAQATGAEPDLMSACLAIYDAHVEPSALVRRLQVAFTGLVPAQAVQPSLFDEGGRVEHAARAAQAALAVRGRFGANALLKGTSLLPEANARERHEQVGGHRA